MTPENESYGKNIVNDITGLIGNTPMIRISNMTSSSDAEIYAKLEWYNVGGSVKDRIALYIIEDAERKGLLDKNKTILEATSGNTGISYAMITAVKGYKVKIVLPASMSIERRKVIKAYGAQIVLSPGDKGTGGAVELKKKMIVEEPDKYVDVDQFRNPSNIRAHYETTGKEIIEQMDGDIDMVVVGVGTAGTSIGISKRLKEYRKDIQVVGVMPTKGTFIQGLRNPKDAFATKLYDSKCFDEVIELPIGDIPEIYKTTRRLARKEGLLVGMSSGAAMRVALLKAKELGKGKKIVVIFPDSGYKYLSTCLFEE